MSQIGLIEIVAMMSFVSLLGGLWWMYPPSALIAAGLIGMWITLLHVRRSPPQDD